MGTTISRWGNSLAVRLPKNALAVAALREGDDVTVSAENGCLVLRPARSVNIAALVAAITPETLPDESFDSAPIGKEML